MSLQRVVRLHGQRRARLRSSAEERDRPMVEGPGSNPGEDTAWHHCAGHHCARDLSASAAAIATAAADKSANRPVPMRSEVLLVDSQTNFRNGAGRGVRQHAAGPSLGASIETAANDAETSTEPH